jgi:competence protein ComGC
VKKISYNKIRKICSGGVFMKKLIMSILLMISILLLSIPAYATENSQDTDLSMDEKLVSVLKNQLSADEYEILNNKDLYNKNNEFLKDFSLEDKPVIRIYWEDFWGFSMNELIDVANARNYKAYAVLDDEYVLLKIVFQDGTPTIIGKVDAEPTLPNYLADLKMMTAETEILGQQCKIENVYCFDTLSMYLGTAVYYCTDQGVFVKYYDYEDALSSTGFWFAEQDFNFYSEAYADYLAATAYDENGVGLNGRGTGFLEYIENQEEYDKQAAELEAARAKKLASKETEEPERKNDEPKQEKAENGTIIIAVASVAVIGVVFLVVLYVIRKRRTS